MASDAMTTTKPATGWTQAIPTVSGWYWLKDDTTGPVLTEALNGCFYIHNSRYTPEPRDKWLGPITPADFEQLTALREQCVKIAESEAQQATRDEAISNDDFDRGRCHAAIAIAAALRNALGLPEKVNGR